MLTHKRRSHGPSLLDNALSTEIARFGSVHLFCFLKNQFKTSKSRFVLENLIIAIQRAIILSLSVNNR